MNQRRGTIGAAFGAARDYDRHALVQAQVAQGLAARITALPLPPSPRVLEIGCGTGHLTAALADIGGDWLVTDLAPQMLERARERVGTSGRHFAVLDGEHGPRPAGGGFDLICSSLAFQWFDDPAAAAARLLGWLRPGGWLAVTTLGGGTFAEWRKAHAALDLTPGTVALPAAQALAARLPGAKVCAELLDERHADAREFLRAVKAIGAGTPAPGHRPLGAGALRRVMRAFEHAGSRASYEVVTILWQKAAP